MAIYMTTYTATYTATQPRYTTVYTSLFEARNLRYVFVSILRRILSQYQTGILSLKAFRCAGTVAQLGESRSTTAINVL